MSLLEENDQPFELSGNPSEIDRDFYVELVGAGLTAEAAQDIAAHCEDDSLEELLYLLEGADNQEEKNDIVIYADARMRDFFWGKVNDRISDPNTQESSVAEVIFYLLSKL